MPLRPSSFTLLSPLLSPLLLPVLLSSCNPPEQLACGANTHQVNGECVGSPSEVGGEASACGRPPTFGGVVDVSPISPTSLQVSWADTSDPVARAHLRIRVYVSASPGSENFAAPVVETAPGATHVRLIDLSPAGATWYVKARAVDECGQVDGNDVEASGIAAADDLPPTFGGVTTALPSSERGGSVRVSWDAASDDHTGPGGVVYLVYASTSGPDVFSTTPTLTEPGATSLVVTGLGDATATYTFAVRARDAAGNVEHNKITKTSIASPDAAPPVFAGCSDAVAKNSSSIVVAFRAPVDDAAPVEQLVVHAYVGTAPGKEDFSKPAATFRASDLGGTIPGLSANTSYSIVCRAADPSSHEEANVVELSAKTGVDHVPPGFAGLVDVTSIDSTTVALSWAAATDDETLPANLVYTAYVGDKSPDYGAPRASVTGATTVRIGGLLAAHDYVFAVRASDAAKPPNEEANTVVKPFRTSDGFLVIQDIFDLHCAKSGCHVIDGAAPFPLIAGASYGQIVDVPAAEVPSLFRVAKGDSAKSYLYMKITGAPGMLKSVMPPTGAGVDPLSAGEIATIKRWIDLGATSK